MESHQVLHSDSSFKNIKEKIINGQYSVFQISGKSNVWSYYAGVFDENGCKIENIVTCKKCNNIFKYNKTSTSNLLKHKCYVLAAIEKRCGSVADVNLETKKKIVSTVTEWAIGNCRSFKMLEDSGLKKFASVLIGIGAQYGDNVNLETLLPHPTTLSRNVSKLYDKYFEEIKLELSKVITNGYGVTTDMWTDNYLKMSYLAMTIHYIIDGKLNNKLLAMKSMQGERSTAENIKLKVSATLADFNCELQGKTIIVTDRGANMISAFRTYDHIFCINHLLHNTLEKSIKECAAVAELCSNCSKLVKYFKKSGLNANLQSTLKSFCPTRWNTVFYLLKSIKNNWDGIISILEDKNEIQKSTGINLNVISRIVQILAHFEEATRMLEGENYPTLHWTYIYIHRLKKICSITQDDCDVIKEFKKKLSHYIDYVVVQNLNIYHKIALFLFPPANKLKQFSESEKKMIKTECKNLMKVYAENVKEEKDNMPSTSKISSLNSELLDDFVEESELVNYDEKIEREILQFEGTHVQFYDNFDTLYWWNIHRVEFPFLYRLSCKILATPASSAASERSFSMARNLISEKRSKIGNNGETVKKLMFLHANVKISNIYNEMENIIE